MDKVALRLLLVEGRRHTGAALTADDATAVVHEVREHVHVELRTSPLSQKRSSRSTPPAHSA
jgi:hypothetical protein